MQYVSIKYTKRTFIVSAQDKPSRIRLAEAGLVPSVGSVGDSYDNALAEMIHRCGPWRSLEAVEFATLDRVDWFNNRRLLSSIGNMPPTEAEARYYASLEELSIAA